VPDASDITRRAKSNLAFALRILPKDRRDDMVIFYAFCRQMDDIADDPDIPPDRKTAELNAWKDGLQNGFEKPDEFRRQLLALRDRHQIPGDLLTAIIDGCLMDVQPRRFRTWQDLDGYIWKVACAVGLISIRIFGCKDSASETYALALGRALQLTNILRDVGEDFENGGRIYLPAEDLARFDYTENDLAGRVADGRFLRLMAFQADRADGFFRDAESALSASDRRALLPARIMAGVYQSLLSRMRRDGFRVFGHRYRVSRLRKLAILSKHVIAG
jgi:phytoene synthase